MSWWGEKKEDPNVALIREMLDVVKTQSERQAGLVEKLIDTQKDQNETTRLLLGQYLAVGTPTTSSLDSRLFESEDDVEWDEVVESPFKGI